MQALRDARWRNRVRRTGPTARRSRFWRCPRGWRWPKARAIRPIALMRSAADGEDGSVKHVAMENRLYPMRELLGDLLLEAGSRPRRSPSTRRRWRRPPTAIAASTAPRAPRKAPAIAERGRLLHQAHDGREQRATARGRNCGGPRPTWHDRDAGRGIATAHSSPTCGQQAAAVSTTVRPAAEPVQEISAPRPAFAMLRPTSSISSSVAFRSDRSAFGSVREA